ncbi:MAG: DUF465 domain-containing protein [Sphingomonadaceae bacterium]|nr:DUF465 domain-containing protein [Sphingomonadaceae bacterium]
MSHTPHELADEFPQDHEILHTLKMNNAHFVTLSERYHEVNREIHRIESEVEAASDDRAEDLKKQRLSLVDEISKMISAEKAKA